MTLVLAAHGRETIWLLADRRLTASGRTIRDDARKLMFLEATDGVAILGYAGLGATALPTEPSDWMSAVLRGRSLSIEQSLDLLAKATERELPTHLAKMVGYGRPAHDIIASTFVGSELRLYSIHVCLPPDGSGQHFLYTRHVVNRPANLTPRPPRLAVGGTGGAYLSQRRDWRRPLLHLIASYDQGKVSPFAVADHFARLNQNVHVNVRDETIGPRCIVAWRHRPGGRIHNGAGGHQCYSVVVRDADSPCPPIVVRDAHSPCPPIVVHGMDLGRFFGDLWNVVLPNMMNAVLTGQPPRELDEGALSALGAKVSNIPDEKLR